MSDPHSLHHLANGGPLSRRAFMERLLATGAVAAGGLALAGCSRGGSSSDGLGSGAATLPTDEVAGPIGRVLSSAVDGRVLVIVDLQGGNDGLSTVVPYGSGRYYDLRPNLSVPEEEVLALDDEVGLHPSLARLAERGITTVEGVGPQAGDLSHFNMAARWQRGDVSGDEAGLRSGFLGRLTDALDDGSPLVGVSIGSPTGHLTNQLASTMSLPSADELWFLQPADYPEAARYQQQLGRFAAEGQASTAPMSLLANAGNSYRQLLELGERLPDSDGIDWEHPMIADGGDLGWRMYSAAALVAADLGTRVVYVPTGDYDTHSGHEYRQRQNLAELDVAIDGFLSRAEDLGFADRVAVATISEFGRRVPENDSGLDHGSASTMLVAGPVGDVRAGDRPPLGDLDEDDNLRTTVGFDRYLASLAEEWLGVEAASVLPGNPELLGLF